MKTKAFWLVVVSLVAGNLGVATQALADIQDGQVLTRQEVISHSVGGELRNKNSRSGKSLRVMCLEYSIQPGPVDCVRHGLVLLSDEGADKVRVSHITEYVAGTDPRAEAASSIEKGRFRRRVMGKRDPGEVLIGIVPVTTLASIFSGLVYSEGSKGFAIVSGIILIPVGFAVDVVTAPVRAPVKIIRLTKYNTRMKRFLKSIVNGDVEFTTELGDTDFSEIAQAMHVFSSK